MSVEVKLVRIAVALAASVLSGCGGGGSGSGGWSCAYIPGEVTGQAASTVCGNDCVSENYDAVADMNQGSAARVSVETSQRTTTIKDEWSGTPFHAGSKAGALVTMLRNANAGAITITTLMNGAPMESFSGAALTAEPTNGATKADTYLNFTSSIAFNGMQIVINAAADSEYRIYEFCGDS